MDGFSDAVEAQLGTDPRDPDSRPTLADNNHTLDAWWPLWQDADDRGPHGLDGTTRHGADFQDGALELDGRNDYVSFGSDPLLSSAETLSVSLWIRPDYPQSFMRVLGKFQSSANQCEFAVFLFGGRVGVALSQDGSPRGKDVVTAMTWEQINGTDRPWWSRRRSAPEWTHLVVRWSAEDGVAVLLDGTPSETFSFPDRFLNSLHTGEAPLTLGAYDILTLPGTWWRPERELVRRPFRGTMASLALFNKPLTDLQARELHLLGPDGDLAVHLDADVDADGMPDWWERAMFGNIAPEADGDEDQDGLANLEEYTLNADPMNPDTDGDGMPDGWEHRYGLDPTQPDEPDADPDDDGLTNIREARAGTDPHNPDTDGDGVNDFDEVQAGTDPLDPESFTPTLHVDDDWAGVDTGADPDGDGPAAAFGADAFAAVRDAVDAAPAGARIRVAPGVYTERLHIDKSLTIVAAEPAAPLDGEQPTVAIRPADVSDQGALVEIGSLDDSADTRPQVRFEGIVLDGAAAYPSNPYPFVGVNIHGGAAVVMDRCRITNIRASVIGGLTGYGAVINEADFSLLNSVADEFSRAAVSAFGDGRIVIDNCRFTGQDLSSARQFSQTVVALQEKVTGAVRNCVFRNVGPSGQTNPDFGHARVALDETVGYALDIKSTHRDPDAVAVENNTFENVQAVYRDTRLVSSREIPVTAGEFLQSGNTVAPEPWIALGPLEHASRIFARRDDDPNLLNAAILSYKPFTLKEDALTLAGGSTHTLTRDLANPEIPLELRSSNTETVTVVIPNADVPSRISAGPRVRIRHRPGIEITSPEHQAALEPGADIQLRANPSDPDGDIAAVQFRDGDTLIGAVDQAPWEITWTPDAQGPRNLTAVAVDNHGYNTTSRVLPVTVGTPNCILWEHWDTLWGNSLADLLLHPDYPRNPSDARHIDRFETPAQRAINYGARVRGYVLPPETGDYVFWITASRTAELHLSTDEHPENTRRIASARGTPVGEWRNRKSRSNPVRLEAGKRYYIEAIHKQDMSNDHLAVGWQLPDGTLERPIPGPRLAPFIAADELPAPSISELNLRGIEPDAADSDGDGLTDAEERRITGTDPETSDADAPGASALQTVDHLDGDAFTVLTGRWRADNGRAVCETHAGSLRYTLEVDQPGIHRIAVRVAQDHPDPYHDTLDLTYHLDGAFLGRETPSVPHGRTHTTVVYTPYIPAGKHHLDIEWWNVYPRMAASILDIRVQTVGGADADADGAPDWQRQRLETLAAVDPDTLTSPVSPACLEGAAAWPELMTVTADNTPCEVRKTEGRSWYADVPLQDSDDPTPVRVSFQNGGRTKTVPVQWTPTNILNAENPTIRAGDALRLAAVADGIPGTAPVTITVDGAAVATDSATPVVHRFDTPGAHTVRADLDNGARQAEITVTVRDIADTPRPILWLNQTRKWTWSGVPAETRLSGGDNLPLLDTTIGRDPRKCRIAARSLHETGGLAARIGTNGPVQKSLLPRVIDVRSTVLGYVNVVETFSDGATMIENTLYIRNLPDDLEIVLSVNTAGAIFEDGSYKRVLSLDDFTDTGALTYRVLRPAGKTTTCHTVLIKQNGTTIGRWL